MTAIETAVTGAPRSENSFGKSLYEFLSIFGQIGRYKVASEELMRLHGLSDAELEARGLSRETVTQTVLAKHGLFD